MVITPWVQILHAGVRRMPEESIELRQPMDFHGPFAPDSELAAWTVVAL